jgi:crotonobetainyl-CoA:carnitine CoA-transferase CaiB-like acyl-CoA transferase
VACYQVYETRDGRYVSIGALEPKFWSTLCRLLGREDLIGKQYDHSPETVEALGKIFASRTSKEWDALLSEEEVCYAPVLDPKEATENHQVRHREMILPAAGPDHAVQQQVGIVPKFSVTPGRVRMPSPEPGQHTHEVLRQLGMDAHRIAEMEKEGVVKGISPP